MDKIKSTALITTSFFTVFMLLLCGIASAESGGTEMDIKRFADNAFTFFLRAVVIGLSFLLFDIKKLPKAWQRIFHIVLNYAAMVFFLFFIAQSYSSDRTATVFAFTFVFIALYFLGMLVSRLLKKLSNHMKA